MTRLEDYGGQQWGVAPPLNETAPEDWEPRIVKMTRLEEIEQWLTSHEAALKGTCQPKDDLARNLFYALDCYKARVGVLEEAILLAFKAESAGDGWGNELSKALDLTPEQCLERYGNSHNGQKGADDGGPNQ